MRDVFDMRDAQAPFHEIENAIEQAVAVLIAEIESLHGAIAHFEQLYGTRLIMH